MAVGNKKGSTNKAVCMKCLPKYPAAVGYEWNFGHVYACCGSCGKMDYCLVLPRWAVRVELLT